MKIRIPKSKIQILDSPLPSPPRKWPGMKGRGLRFGIWCLVLGVLVVSIFPLPAHGFSLVPCGRSSPPGNEPCDLSDLISLIMRMINYLISIAGVVAMYEILSAGFNMISALGNAEKIQHSKEQIAQAVVGFAIVVLAFVFVNLLVNVLFGASSTERKWWDPNCLYNITNPTVNDECPKPDI